MVRVVQSVVNTIILDVVTKTHALLVITNPYNCQELVVLLENKTHGCAFATFDLEEGTDDLSNGKVILDSGSYEIEIYEQNNTNMNPVFADFVDEDNLIVINSEICV